VSFVKPSTFNDGHPRLLEGRSVRVLQPEDHRSGALHKELWDSTAILVTVDEGGGYYDSATSSRSTTSATERAFRSSSCQIFAGRTRGA